jgi:hypothetical protein
MPFRQLTRINRNLIAGKHRKEWQNQPASESTMYTDCTTYTDIYTLHALLPCTFCSQLLLHATLWMTCTTSHLAPISRYYFSNTSWTVLRLVRIVTRRNDHSSRIDFLPYLDIRWWRRSWRFRHSMHASLTGGRGTQMRRGSTA